jgi:hypothetical protein
VNDTCIPDNGTCRGGGEDTCINDSYCACPPEVKAPECVCVPWGMKPRGDHDDMCIGQGFSPGEFKAPVLKCEWPKAGTDPAYKNVISTPLVIDLDKDGQPEIVFAAGYPGQVHLIAMSGKDCTVRFDKATSINGCTHIAAGDLDGDGFPEIVAQAPGTAVYDRNGDLKASIATPGAGSCTRDYPPAIANLDGMGPPEIIMGGQVARYVAVPTPKIELVWTVSPTGGTWGTISLAEDMDGDGLLEVITGTQVLDGAKGTNKTPSVMASLQGGYPAVGDFNMDGHPDIVLVTSRSGGQQVAVIDYFNNKFIMPPTPAAMGWGGAPTVADFDGDGRPEFATASAVNYYVYSPDCLADPKPAKCKGTDRGVLWQSQTQDSSSGSTGSSVFDFNGDKIAEVVYRDECWLRVYNGPDGKKLFAAPVSSGTDLEMPVIADVDLDGHADIVVASDMVQGDNCRSGVSASEFGMPHGPPTFGVKVYKDPMDRWMPSRGIWNQHAYHITNVNDDGTIPLKELPNFRTYNNYRQNVQGMATGGAPIGDPTGKIGIAPDSGDCVNVWRVSAAICNRGSAPLGMGLPATFYDGDPRAMPPGKPICTALTTQPLQPGKCQIVSCEWKMPPQGSRDLWLRVNDNGSGGRPFAQCKSGNDLSRLGNTTCGQIPG